MYRLPSEAEWEYACRGGATSQEECSYHFYFAKPTNDLSSEQANFNGAFPFGKAPKRISQVRTTKVGSYAPNKLGLYDMHGNVYQWCADLYIPGRSEHVIRGGSWSHEGSECRAGNRASASGYQRAPTPQSPFLGFRLVRVPSAGKVGQASQSERLRSLERRPAVGAETEAAAP